MKFYTVLYTLLLSFLMSTTALAGTLSLETSITVTVNEAAKEVIVAISLTNRGDEHAKEVGLSFPTVNQSHPVSDDLAPQASAATKMSFGFKDLGITQQGIYRIPFHTIYKDTNFFPFSAPQQIVVNLPPLPSRAVTLMFDDIEAGTPLALSKIARTEATLTNLTAQPVEITSLLPFGPAEIFSTFRGITLPLTLAAQEEKKITFEFRNQNALIGSSYATSIFISGTSAGKHIAEAAPLIIQIVEGSIRPGLFYQIAALIIGLSVILVAIVRFRSTRL